jgi:hypothetical protein
VSARSWAVRVLVAGVGIVALLLCTAAATTGWQTLPTSFTSGRLGVFVPAWTRPCARSNPARGTRYILACARVRGRVIYRQNHDPDGDRDRHLVVISGLRLVTIKVPKEARIGPLPGIGARVTAAGTLSRQHDHGLSVVRVGTLTSP